MTGRTWTISYKFDLWTSQPASCEHQASEDQANTFLASQLSRQSSHPDSASQPLTGPEQNIILDRNLLYKAVNLNRAAAAAVALLWLNHIWAALVLVQKPPLQSAANESL